jgi:hypothetical protein
MPEVSLEEVASKAIEWKEEGALALAREVEFATALVALQAEVTDVARNALNPHFNHPYATLEVVLAEVRPLLTKHGFALLHGLDHFDGRPAFLTRLTHRNTESWTFLMPLPEITDPQKLVAYVTYLRRATIKALLGMAEADDDGNSLAEPPPTLRPAPRPTPKPRPEGADPNEFHIVDVQVGKTGPASKEDPNVPQWTKYEITTEEGEVFATFKMEHVTTAREAAGKGLPVRCKWKLNERYHNNDLESIEIVPPVAPPPQAAPPPTQSLSVNDALEQVSTIEIKTVTHRTTTDPTGKALPVCTIVTTDGERYGTYNTSIISLLGEGKKMTVRWRKTAKGGREIVALGMIHDPGDVPPDDVPF